jgi:hypothetical protein
LQAQVTAATRDCMSLRYVRRDAAYVDARIAAGSNPHRRLFVCSFVFFFLRVSLTQISNFA